MKKSLLFILILFISSHLCAQEQLPNSNLKTWSNPANPDYWATEYSLNPTVTGFQTMATQDFTNHLTGNSSLKLTVDSVYVNGQNQLWWGTVYASSTLAGTVDNTTFNQYPNGIAFDYKYLCNGPYDKASVSCAFKYQGQGVSAVDQNSESFASTTTNGWVHDTIYFTFNGFEGPTDELDLSFSAVHQYPGTVGTTLWLQNVQLIYTPCGFTSLSCVPTAPSCNGGNDGSINITYSGLSGEAYNFSSYNGAPFTVFQSAGYSPYTLSAEAGTYVLWFYDWGGSYCSDFDTIVVNQPAPLTVSVTTTPTNGSSNDGTATAHVSGGTQPYSYSWSNSQTTTTISNLPVGTCYVNVIDNNGCVAYSSATVGYPHPSVTTNAATNVQLTSVQLNGVVNPNNTPDTVSFEWGNTNTYGNSNPGSPNIVNGTGSNTVTTSLFGLVSNTTYHYRTVATVYGTSYYGSDQQFTTTPSTTPTITTNPATGISTTGAQLNGVVEPVSTTATDIGFEWGTTTSYGSTLAATPGSANGSGSTNVSASLTGLQVNTTYYFQAMATDGSTIYGGQQQFTTGGGSSGSPGITSNPASSVTTTSAQLNATINPNGSTITGVSFDWGTSTSYGNTNAASQSSVSGSSSVNVNASIGALQPNTTYYYQGVATVSGNQITGGQQQFYTSTTGVPQVSIENARIYPNPAKHQFTVETNSNETYTLVMYNMMGEKVAERLISQPVTTVDISLLAGGIYTVSLVKDEAVKSFRLVVMSE